MTVINILVAFTLLSIGGLVGFIICAILSASDEGSKK